MEPIPIDVLAIYNLCSLREEQLVFGPHARVPTPKRHAHHTHATIRWEALLLHEVRHAGGSRLHNIRSDKLFMHAIEFDVRGLTPAPQLQLAARGARDLAKLLHEAAASDEVLHHDSTLSAAAVIESNNDHAVTFWTAAPAVVAVFGADAARGDLFRIAGCADIVVAGLCVGHFAHAGEAVEAGLGGFDGAVADVTCRVED